MRTYKCLPVSRFDKDGFHIEPVREQDKYPIMEIRNGQLFHLRQQEPLTPEKQDRYFETVVSDLFEQAQPSQLLFSFFERGTFVGYGGLVHLNWTDRHAEISFVMKTELQQEHFAKYWSAYLPLIEQVAFEALDLHKIFTYAFDLRPHLYPVLESCGYRQEARLKEHCYFEGRFVDVVYHAKFNTLLAFRRAEAKDMQLYFDWANEASVREHSYQSAPISLEDHKRWFEAKITDANCLMLVFENHLKQPVGQVRIQKQSEGSAVIGISNDVAHRGMGYASRMIAMASEIFLRQNPGFAISAYIKTTNTASEKGFAKAGYQLREQLNYEDVPSFHYIMQP